VRQRLARATGSVARHLAPQVTVGLLIVAYVTIFGILSLRRHQNLRTNALDLGYTDQAVWNTLHGRPFRFSTYLDAAFQLDIPIQESEKPDLLLGYHVEPILAAISLLYLLHDGPETLLWLQTVGIALGAIPLFLIARHRFELWITGHESRLEFQVFRWLPVAFVLLYLLSPPLEAANLSDFHTVALSPALLLAAFYFLETDRPWGFVAFAFLGTMCKEEMGLLVAMMGLWAAFVRRRWILGLGVAVASAGWSFLSALVIMPHFNGLDASPFLVRYRQFGDSLAAILQNLVRHPGLFLDWLHRPDVLRYLRGLLLTSGGLAVLYPLGFLMALPSVIINSFSVYDWMHSGGGHYSASIVPFLMIAAIYGVEWVARVMDRWVKGRWLASGRSVFWSICLALAALGLGIALGYHHDNGVSPLSRRFALDPVSEHARRAQPFFEWIHRLPPEVPISASSSIYPHVAHRERVYLFPTVSDAQFILLDVTGPPSPVGIGDQRQIVGALLDYAEFGVAASDHGFLLLERGLDQYRFSPTFYDVFHAAGSDPQVSVATKFGNVLVFEGFDWEVRPVVRPGLSVEITTYWRALSPLDDGYRLIFYFWDDERRLVRVQPEELAVHWFPSWLWEPDQVVKLTLSPLPVGDLPYAGVAVLLPRAQDSDVEGRLVPIRSTTGETLSLWEQETILELVRP
jgi:uncharacterized membrane protein